MHLSASLVYIGSNRWVDECLPVDPTPGCLAQAVEQRQPSTTSAGLHEVQQQQMSHTYCSLQLCTYISSYVRVVLEVCMHIIQRFVAQLKP